VGGFAKGSGDGDLDQPGREKREIEGERTEKRGITYVQGSSYIRGEGGQSGGERKPRRKAIDRTKFKTGTGDKLSIDLTRTSLLEPRKRGE